MSTPIADRVAELSSRRVPFARAVVVRAQQPSSTRSGDVAIVLADGTMEGFVGGHCTTDSVRQTAIAALRTGESTLLRVMPEPDSFPDVPGASVVINPCLSGGAMEIFVEPILPVPLLHVTGTSPIVTALADVAPALGFDVVTGESDVAGATVAIVCRHGGEEEDVRRALDAGVPFVGIVCSMTRGKFVLEALDLSPEELARVHPHVGVDIGARTPPEIALSVLGAVVRAMRIGGLGSVVTEPVAAPQTAIDPICGMTVSITPDAISAEVAGTTYWFCCPGCRHRYLKEHAEAAG